MIADSSTEAMPSITVPSPGISSPASTTTTSPFCSSEARFVVPSCRCATVSVRIARSASAWARPRPSASASARLANTTVSHSQNETVNVNHAGSSPPPSGLPPNTWMSQATVVITAPISTTNITGLRICTRGSSLRSDSISAGRRDALEQRSTATSSDCARPMTVSSSGCSLSRARLSSSTFTPGSPRTPRARPSVFSSISCLTRRAGCGGPRRCGGPGCARWPARCAGRRPRRSW